MGEGEVEGAADQRAEAGQSQPTLVLAPCEALALVELGLALISLTLVFVTLAQGQGQADVGCERAREQIAQVEPVELEAGCDHVEGQLLEGLVLALELLDPYLRFGLAADGVGRSKHEQGPGPGRVVALAGLLAQAHQAGFARDREAVARAALLQRPEPAARQQLGDGGVQGDAHALAPSFARRSASFVRSPKSGRGSTLARIAAHTLKPVSSGCST